MPAPRHRDLAETARQLESWLVGVLPDARAVEVSMDGGPSDTGFSSDTLLFEAIWQAADGAERREPLVARLEPTGFSVFPSYDVGRQFHVMQILDGTDVPVPRMRWLVEDSAVLGVPFYVMDRVEGRVPSDNPPYNTGGWVHDLSVADRERLWWNGLEAMSRVHRLDVDALGLGFLAQPEFGVDPVDQLLGDYAAFTRWNLDPARHPLITRAQDWLHARRPMEESVALCWGDSRLANQIFDGLECAAVIDWEMAHLGNPVHDLAWWIAIDRCFADGIGLTRLEGLPDRAATAARWEQLTGRKAENLDYYEVMSLFQFTVIMARIGLQLKHYGLIPADHEMDRQNLASVVLAMKLDEIGA